MCSSVPFLAQLRAHTPILHCTPHPFRLRGALPPRDRAGGCTSVTWKCLPTLHLYSHAQHPQSTAVLASTNPHPTPPTHVHAPLLPSWAFVDPWNPFSPIPACVPIFYGPCIFVVQTQPCQPALLWVDARPAVMCSYISWDLCSKCSATDHTATQRRAVREQCQAEQRWPRPSVQEAVSRWVG